jgi:uncharacterized protein (DUF427 family)
MKALWNGKIIAESDDILKVEGNSYFPIESVNKEYLKESQVTSACPWKGKASYFSLEVDGKINKDAAWHYPEPKEAAKEIKGRVAFWKGVEIVDN